MTPDKFSCEIQSARSSRDNRLTIEMPPHISLELLRGRVATGRIFLDGLHHDRVEVALDPSVQLCRARAPCCGKFLGNRDRFGAKNVGGRCWVALEDRARHIVRFARRQLIRWPAGKQNVQQNTQRIDVARRRDGSPPNLLGTGIKWSEKSFARECEIRCGKILAEEFCYSEVEEPDATFGSDENVGGLEVSMHNQVPVGVLHRGANLA